MFKLVVVLVVLIGLVQSSPSIRNKFRKEHNVRIVGGNETTIEENPWQVSIQMLGLHVCGGSIIGPETVLTAAHCIDPFMPFLYTIVVGTTDLLEGGVVVGIKEAVTNDQYNNLDYDSGIITLSESLNFTDKIQPIQLPNAGETPAAGTPVTVSGWGVTEEGAIITPSVLHSVQVNIVDHDECKATLQEFEDVTDRMVCAAVPEGGKDSCQGDSGGPLQADGVLVGIVSWGIGCGEKDLPGVYTDVSSVRDWIKEVSGI